MVCRARPRRVSEIDVGGRGKVQAAKKQVTVHQMGSAMRGHAQRLSQVVRVTHGDAWRGDGMTIPSDQRVSGSVVGAGRRLHWGTHAWQEGQ